MVRTAWIVAAAIACGWPPAPRHAFAAEPEANREQEAKDAFDRARLLFEAEEYDAALPLFRRAYVLSRRRPSTALALAQCERVLGMYAEALLHLREYLASDPAPHEARRVEKTIEVVETLAANPPGRTPAERAAPPLPALTIAPSELAAPEPDRAEVTEVQEEPGAPIWESPIFWIATGVAVVGGAVAIGFLASSSGEPYGGNTGVVARPLERP